MSTPESTVEASAVEMSSVEASTAETAIDLPAVPDPAPAAPAAGGRGKRMAGKAGRLLASAGGAVAVQFVTAGGSLVVQSLAARTLGASGYGAYALLFSIIVMITSVQTSWVGDTLTVFDRFEPRVRGALLLSVGGTVVAGAAVGAVVAAVMHLAGPLGIALFALSVALWLLEETGRRIFTARMEFWRLTVNDACYLLTTLAVLGGSLGAGADASVELLLASMCAGSAASILLARVRLPREEYALAPLRGTAFREILAFSWWRSVQAGIRPTALLLARVMIAGFASTAALAGVEAARLLLSPALTFVNGAGWFLLGDFAKAEKAGRPMRARQAVRACGLMSGIALVMSLGGILLVGWLGPVVTGGSFEVDRVALGGWALYSVCFSCTLPLASLATARKQSRTVFVIRGVESLSGLAVLLGLLAADPGHAAIAPYCLGAGGIVSAVMLWRMLRKGDPPRGGGGTVPAPAGAEPREPGAPARTAGSGDQLVR
ncbi:lipopolysaccharide biosynthesis protein [Actinomadura nitritigenes]|uniref:lipopolysaccharide biosynthesis protein n=1 Tax=Actinomadura nitritigenes TaxID=134602 RepID=UPI003D947089